MYSIQLRHPFGFLVSGGTKLGKTTIVKKLLTYVDAMIEKPPESITYYHCEFQNMFGEGILITQSFSTKLISHQRTVPIR